MRTIRETCALKGAGVIVAVAMVGLPGCSSPGGDASPARTASTTSKNSTPSTASAPAATEARAAASKPAEESQSSPRLGTSSGDEVLDGAVPVAALPHEIIPLVHEIMIELGMSLGLSNVNIREGAAVGYDDRGNEIHVLALRTGEASSMIRVELADESTSPICEDIRDLILERTGP